MRKGGRFLACAAHRAILSSKAYKLSCAWLACDSSRLLGFMDHPCYKCGHSVEDGRPFCAQCEAPQIRVAVAEPATELAASAEAVTALGGEADTGLPGSASSLPVQWPHAPSQIAPCALAAGVAALLMFVGLNPFVAAIVAGFLAVSFSRRGTLTGLRTGGGARLGALSGLLLFGASTILEMLAVVVLHKGADIRAQMMEKFQQAAARYPGPEVKPFLEFVNSPDGFAIMMVASLIFGLIAFILLSALGGAVGAAFLGRRDPK
jgi:hypothetical protein